MNCYAKMTGKNLIYSPYCGCDMDSQDDSQQLKLMFLGELANRYDFFGKQRDVFLSRFDDSKPLTFSAIKILGFTSFTALAN